MNWKTSLTRKSKSSSRIFVLYGNIYDLMVCDGKIGFLPFWMNENVSKGSFVIHYDLSSGLTPDNEQTKVNFYGWLSIYDKQEGTSFCSGQSTKDFNTALTLVKRFAAFVKQDVPDKNVDFFVKYAETIFPSSDVVAPPTEERVGIIRLLNEVGNNMFSGSRLRVFLFTESLSEVNSDLINSDYVSRIQIDFPEPEDRRALILSLKLDVNSISELSLEELVKKTAGLNLIKIYNLIDYVTSCGEKVTYEMIAKEKKRIIEEFCSGLVRFVEPKQGLSLDCVANHTKAKARLKELVWLIKNGKERVLEKGILIPGRVGVGKSFIIYCFASECGLPVMELAEFRSKWVGDTEKQLARILMIIKALGPVIVVVDEADAVFGNREQSGDSGVSSRTFGALASHIGDPSIRGQEIWFAMTSRPDLLPIDLKRQGRFGLCVPLFPAQTNDDIWELFQVVAKTRGIKLSEELKESIVKKFEPGAFTGPTGSEIESIIIRAEERAIFNQRENAIQVEDVREAIESFIDPLDRRLIKLQTYAAILSCSDRKFMTDQYARFTRQEIEDQMYAEMRG